MASPGDMMATEAQPRTITPVGLGAERKRMSNDELVSLCDKEIAASVDWSSTRLSQDRRDSLNAYYGEPYGNERPGRSGVVSRDVLETVEWIMPSLMEIFFSGDEVVRFDPVGPEDIETAEQETQLCNQVFSRDNDGFMIGYTWFKDSLVEKNGVVMSVYEMSLEVTREVYRTR